MKKAIALLFLVPLFVVSCKKASYTDNDLAKLNGYWEIKKAVMPDGSEKDYTVNPAIDHFDIKGKTGKRQKVMPQYDGSYRTSGLSEAFTVEESKDGKTYMDYKTDYADWKEELKTLDDDELVTENEQGIEYHYKHPIPFSVKDGKEAE